MYFWHNVWLQVSDSVTTESVKIGRDGGKFLKKASPAPAPKQAQQTQQTPKPLASKQPVASSPQKKGRVFAF